MIELFPDPQLRLRAAPPIITGVVAVLIFVVKLPQADAFLALWMRKAVRSTSRRTRTPCRASTASASATARPVGSSSQA